MVKKTEKKEKTSKLTSKYEAESRVQLGERIRLIWEGSQLTQADFSETLGITSVTLLNYMKGQRIPDALFVCLLGAKHNICLEWILTGEGPMKPGGATLEGKDRTFMPWPPSDDLEHGIRRLQEKIAVMMGEKANILRELAESRKETADTRGELAAARKDVADAQKEAREVSIEAYKQAMGFVHDLALKGGISTTDVAVSAPSAPSISLTSDE